MATPSLAMIPSGYKAGKVYSVLPESGVGDFDFTRATTATRINSSGLIETVAISVPRLEYPMIDGVVSGCPSLLLENSATNLVTYSEDFSNIYWTKSGASVTSGFSSPDGGLNAFKISEDSLNSTHRILNGNAITTSGDVSISVFAKKGERNWIRLTNNNIQGAFFDLENGVIGNVISGINAKIENYGNGWYRCSISQTGLASERLAVFTSIDGVNTTYQGDGTSGVYIYGAQLEVGSFPTSYIKSNSGSTTTRAAETANGAGDASTFNDSEGVLMAEVSVPYKPSNQIISLSDSTNSDIIFVQFTPTNMFVKIAINGFGESTIHSQSYDVNTLYKVSLKYNGTNTVAYINGFISSIGNVTLSNSFTLGLSKLGFNYPTGVLPFYGNTKQIQYYNSALTDSELEELTSWTSFTAMAQGQQYSIK